MYGGLAFLLAWRFHLAGRKGIALVVVVTLVIAVYGIVDELLQIPVGRNADIADWIAGLHGCCGGNRLVLDDRCDLATVACATVSLSVELRHNPAAVSHAVDRSGPMPSTGNRWDTCGTASRRRGENRFL